MKHRCSSSCHCHKDFVHAVRDLNNASRMLADAIDTDCDEMIENCWAHVRAAKAKAQGARAVFLEHRRDIASR